MKFFNELRKTINLTRYALVNIIGGIRALPYIMMTLLKSVVNAAALVSYTLLPGFIINYLMAGEIRTVVILAATLVATPFVQNSSNSLISVIFDKMQLGLSTEVHAEFHNYTSHLDYEYFESPKVLDMKERATRVCDSVFGVVDCLNSILSSIISFVVILSVVAYINPLMVVFILFIVLLNSMLTKRLNVKNHEIGMKQDNYWRVYWGATFQMENPSYAKEIRVYDISGMLLDNFRKVMKKGNELAHKRTVECNKTYFFQAIVNIVKDGVIYGYSIISVLLGRMAIGTMSIYISAANQFSSNIGSIVNSYLSLSRLCMEVEEYKKFFELPQKQQSFGTRKPSFGKNSTIEFRNVSFKYPGSENYALKNMNLTIRGDERLCIVGENGSGKSTFIKLLSRLYFPTEGEILLDGVNINEYDYREYQNMFSAAFQDFEKFYLPLSKNIALDKDVDEAKLDNICERIGLTDFVKKLPHGYDSAIDKWVDEDGVNPSGGELQRISIARAVYSDRDIYILDEPTAALDPNAEYEIYTQFHNIITDKCAVLITHRLSAVQLADKVAVFENGHVEEYGTHDELYARKGIYTEMFDKQAEFYRQ
ncbi:MAG: ABC transporter ATP-binding protein/permease [Oscillospiraceae bacterium]|nr:ABC transporter ATP-binding protein/permease [Oscillospiraceae bacterium]